MLGRIALDLSIDANLKRRVQAAVKLAGQHGAELIGICTDPPIPQYLAGGSASAAGVLNTLLVRIDEDKTQAREMFLAEAAAAGIKAQCRMPKGPVEEALATHARLCDLLVMSQNRQHESSWGIPPSMAETVIMTAGRPVLMIPFANIADYPIGKNVLFCWDYGRRAARALADAAPILSQASSLTILTVDPQPDMLIERDVQPGDLLAYCAAHGYPVPKEVTKTSEYLNVGDTILNAVTDHGCDMVIMGIYNRSRVREWILGGTSKTLIQSMTVPIMFSH